MGLPPWRRTWGKAWIMAVMGSYSSACLKQLTGQLECPIHGVLNAAKAAARSRDNQETRQTDVNGSWSGCHGSGTTLMLFTPIIAYVEKTSI